MRLAPSLTGTIADVIELGHRPRGEEARTDMDDTRNLLSMECVEQSWNGDLTVSIGEQCRVTDLPRIGEDLAPRPRVGPDGGHGDVFGASVWDCRHHSERSSVVDGGHQDVRVVRQDA